MLILASKSPRRQELLSALGIPFRVETLPVEELTDSQDPHTLPMENALRKAAAVSARFPEDLVLGADTVVLAGNRILGKPRDLAEAAEFLRQLSGTTHEVVTGIVLCRRTPELNLRWNESTRVCFKELSENDIAQYLSAVPVLDKAGAYALQDHGFLLGARGCGEIENVIGLPLRRLKKELQIRCLPA